MTREATLSRRRLRTWIRLLRLTRGTENRLREFLRVNFATTLPRFDVAAALYRHAGPMKMSDLSQRLLVSNGNATAVVDRLERDALVQRLPSGDDRRVVLVELTDKGRAWFETLAAAHEQEVNAIFAGLDHDDLDTIRDLMRRLEDTGDD